MFMFCLAISFEAIASDVAEVKSGPVLFIAETELELGEVSSEDDMIVAEIPFSNSGSELLKIEKVHGPCSCFMGWDGDEEVEAGAKGKIAVFFDRKEIPAGHVTREVHIYSNDPQKKDTLIRLSFTIVRSSVEEELWQLRQEIAGMRQEIRGLRSDLKQAGPADTAQPSVAKPVVDTTVYDIPVGSSPFKGPADAKVTIVESTDFQCPFCIRENPTLTQILQEYPDTVKLVYKKELKGSVPFYG